MRSFLGAPVLINGQPWGTLYLADKRDGAAFTEADEQAVVTLAEWAGGAVANARLYERSERRREELERAVHGLEATRDIAVATGAAPGPERVLELIANRGRELIGARALAIMLRDGEELVVVASSGYEEDVTGRRLPVGSSISGEVLERRLPERVQDVNARLRGAPAPLNPPDARTALLVPMVYRGVGIGVLLAFNRGDQAGPFTEADEQLMLSFAASAANAVAIARSVEADRLRSSMAAADEERRYWARELHDETLQVLGGLRVLLSGTLRRGDVARYQPAMQQAVDAIEQGIAGLRSIIADLRPAALDDIGLKPALEALLDRRSEGELTIERRIDLPAPGHGGLKLDPELETTVYRLVQEALTNVVKHARASTVQVRVSAVTDQVSVMVRDDGIGFDVSKRSDGYGLAGMRERVYLSDGSLEIESGDGGTEVRISLPARYVARTGASPEQPTGS